jgi:hypothetical protein
MRPVRGDLAGLRVVDLGSGSVFRVYADSVSAATARELIPRLHHIYILVAMFMGAEPGLVDWAAVAFVGDADHTPPREGRETRWHLETDAEGRLTPESADRMFWFIPHEQAHTVHGTFAADVPRWFSEGVAAWVEMRVAERLASVVAVEVRARYDAAAAAEPVNLGGWGGVSARPEAILRQVPPEQRERMEREPGYSPPGPFSFGPDDFVTDLADEKARYAAALHLFEGIEQEVGLPALQRWLATVWELGGRWRTSDLVALAREELGIDLEPRLR